MKIPQMKNLICGIQGILKIRRNNHEHHTNIDSDRVIFNRNDDTESLEEKKMSSEFLAGLLIGLVMGAMGMALTFCTVYILKE